MVSTTTRHASVAYETVDNLRGSQKEPNPTSAETKDFDIFEITRLWLIIMKHAKIIMKSTSGVNHSLTLSLALTHRCLPETESEAPYANFQTEPERVWVVFDENSCIFIKKPLSLSGCRSENLRRALLNRFQEEVDGLGPEIGGMDGWLSLTIHESGWWSNCGSNRWVGLGDMWNALMRQLDYNWNGRLW